mmetsp:Transcript_28096/g.79155  ORF Transcript_28096/g.79155 Transcript_28096/m.79155 type:complete len:177 (-) Transcript_28096:208-738(-)
MVAGKRAFLTAAARAAAFRSSPSAVAGSGFAVRISGLDLGAASPALAAALVVATGLPLPVKGAAPDLPVWHLARRLGAHGHLLNVGVPVTALVSGHGVCATPAWLDEELREAAAKTRPAGSSGAGGGFGGGLAPPSALLSCGPSSEVQASASTDGSKPVMPLDYWKTYNERMGVFN